MSRIIVIGAGASGLATAGLLARRGHAVTVLDRGSHPGGRAGRWEPEGYRFDTGPSWYLMPEVFDRWFRLMGSSADEALDLVPLDPGYRVQFADEHIDLSADAEATIALFEERSPGAGPQLRAHLDSARETYRMALSHFLYDDFSSWRGLANREVLGRAGSLLGLLGRSLSDATAQFADPRLRTILQYPAVFLGTVPDAAPAMYHLMSHLDLEQGVLFPRGGMVALVDAMVAACRDAGAEITLETEVTGIELDARRRVRGVRLSDGEMLAADAVVGAIDLHHLETELLPAEARSHPERVWRRRNPGPGAITACLGVEGATPELLHHTLFFSDAWEDGFRRISRGAPPPDPASLYVCRPSATDPELAPPGEENLFLLIPCAAEPDWGRGGIDGAGEEMIESHVDAALEQISAWSGLDRPLGERVRVRRTWGPGDFAHDFHAWRGGALGLAHTLRQSAMLRPGLRPSRVDGLICAGASVRPGIGLPMCLISGELATAAIEETLR